jgi:hypothetical protein
MVRPLFFELFNDKIFYDKKMNYCMANGCLQVYVKLIFARWKIDLGTSLQFKVQEVVAQRFDLFLPPSEPSTALPPYERPSVTTATIERVKLQLINDHIL